VSYNIIQLAISQGRKATFCAKIWSVKKIIFIATVVIFLLIINGLFRSIIDTWHKQDLLTQAEKKLEQEKQLNQKLKAQLSVADSKEFIEEQARNKLFMGRPGEQPVIIPENLLKQKEKKKVVDVRPNYQKWWDLFFKN
jgi:cell division protein FtsB